MFYMMYRNKKQVSSLDLNVEKSNSEIYQRQYLESEYSYIKSWMKNAPIDAFTSASMPYTGMDRAKDVGKDLLKSALTLGTVKFTTVETPSFVVLSEGKMHYFSTDVDGDLSEHLIFNASRLTNAIVTLEKNDKNPSNANSKTEDMMTKKYLFTFDIDGQKSAIQIYDSIAFNNNITSLFGNKYSEMYTKNKVVGEQFYSKITELYPNLVAKKQLQTIN